MADESADCRTVATQAELDAALAERETTPAVCIHVHGDAEASVLEWERANRPEPKPAGNW